MVDEFLNVLVHVVLDLAVSTMAVTIMPRISNAKNIIQYIFLIIKELPSYFSFDISFP